MADDRQLVIHAVHGTWPYGLGKQRQLRKHDHNESLYDPERPPWFHPESQFARDILSRWHAFHWNGANSFNERRKASIEFSQKMLPYLTEPDTRHVIVAHRHGGTIVASALWLFSEREIAAIDGVITMGTPFITMKTAERTSLSNAYFFVARLVPFAIALFGVSMLVSWLLAGTADLLVNTILTFIVACVLFLVAANSGRLSDLVFGPSPHAGALLDAFERGDRFKKPFVALRAATDEAGLVIGAAQFVNFFSGKLWMASVQFFGGNFSRWLDRSQSTRRKHALFMIAHVPIFWLIGWVGGYFTARQLTGTAWDRWLDLGAPFIAGFVIYGLFFAGLFLALMMLTVLIIVPAITLVALSCGGEVFRLSGLADIECEPVPGGMRAVVETLALTKEDQEVFGRIGGLKHSFYELPSARRRIVELIRHWTGRPL
jgi:hypothetical protein